MPRVGPTSPRARTTVPLTLQERLRSSPCLRNTRGLSRGSSNKSGDNLLPHGARMSSGFSIKGLKARPDSRRARSGSDYEVCIRFHLGSTRFGFICRRRGLMHRWTTSKRAKRHRFGVTLHALFRVRVKTYLVTYDRVCSCLTPVGAALRVGLPVTASARCGFSQRASGKLIPGRCCMCVGWGHVMGELTSWWNEHMCVVARIQLK
eukprot:7029362-Prymnesium_polylepis.1